MTRIYLVHYMVSDNLGTWGAFLTAEAAEAAKNQLLVDWKVDKAWVIHTVLRPE